VVDAKASRYAKEFGLSKQLAKELAADKDRSAFFEECAKLDQGYQEMAGLIVGELSGGPLPVASALPPDEFVALVKMIESSAITRSQAKDALREALRTGRRVGDVVKQKNLSAVVDERAIAALIDRVVAARPGALDEARGDNKSFSYLVGQVLKEEPNAQPGVVAKLLAQRLRGK